VHDHDPYAQRMQQRKVLRQHRQGAGHDQFTRKGDHECFTAKGMNVWRDRTQPLYELNGIFHERHYNSPRHVCT